MNSEDKDIEGVPLLIQQHKRDICEFKQKESQWIKDQNLLAGSKQIIEELSTKMVEITKANLVLLKRAQEAEGENTIIKGIGTNSPEMKELQERLGSAQDINDNHQRYNGKLQLRLTEIEEDNKRLSKQIQDLTTSRKFGAGTH